MTNFSWLSYTTWRKDNIVRNVCRSSIVESPFRWLCSFILRFDFRNFRFELRKFPQNRQVNLVEGLLVVMIDFGLGYTACLRHRTAR